MLNIFYGRESVDHEKFIYSNIDPKGRALIIVPDQYTLEAERRLFKETGAEALMDIEVISMSRLGYRLLSELGGSKRVFIDKYGRHMVLSQVAREQRDKLEAFRGLETRSSFLEMVNNFISEMKQYNCGLDELETIRDGLDPDTYIYRKLKDMALIYGEYEKKISGRYTDSEDYIDLFLSKIEKSELVRGNHIWIYGFDSFAPKAMAVIGELMTYAADVNVVLTCSMDKRERDGELFELGRIVMRNLIENAELRRIQHSEQAIPLEFQKFADIAKYAPTRHIEREIYALPSRTYLGTEGAPIMVKASNLYNEAENAAGYVLHLIRDEGYRLKDIKIILNDQDVRGPIVRRVFEEYGLDVFSDSGRDVLDNPIIRYVLSVLDVVIRRFDTPSVIAMLKTGLAGLTHEEIADLENYVIKYRIKGSMWKKPFMRGTFEYDEDALGRINELRRRAVEPVIGFAEAFKATTYRDFIRKFYDFLKKDADLVRKIEDLENTQVEEGREDLAEETDQVWDSFLNITEQINEIMGDEAFAGDAFRELLETGLVGIKVGMLPPSKDGLIMGTMQRTRTGEVKVLVVLGANEGVLPSGKPSQGIFGDDEKERFEEIGIKLLKRDPIALMEEKMGIYRNLSNASDRLYMSYSMSDLDGNALKPSAIWLKLKDIFPSVDEVTDCVSSRNMDLLINGEKSGLRHMANSLERSTEGERISQPVKEGINWYKLNDPEKLEAIRRGINFTNRADELGREMASKLFKKDPSGDLSLSPSRIERFSRCPFSHFVYYGLSPKERRIFEVAPREIGDLYHACLMRLTNHLSVKGMALTDPQSPWMTITDEELEELIKEFLKIELATYRDGVFKLGNEEKYRSDRILDTCIQVAKNLVSQVRAGSILKGSFEVGFGRGREIPPIEIKLGEEDGNATAYVEGIIDRVDYLPDSRVKIIDYKTGDEKFTINEAEKGYRLQLMLYLQAAMEKSRKPAGIFYFRIKEPSINMTGKVSEDMDPQDLNDELTSAITKEFKLNGIMVNDPDVIRNIAGDFDGYSDIVQLRNGKDGIVPSTRGEERLLSDEDFMNLKDKVAKVVAGKVAELMRGRIDIHPMKTSERSACTFCQYKGICRFDTTFEGNSWNIID